MVTVQPPPPPPLQEYKKDSRHVDFLLIFGAIGVLILIIVFAIRSSTNETASAEQCYSPLISEFECLSDCTGTCETRYTTENGLVCQECIPRDASRDINCPDGTTSDLAYCNSECPNGLCMAQVSADEATCYACFSCPDGLLATKQACDDSCDTECVVRGEKDKLHCWGCPQSCTDTCRERGYNTAEHDYTDYVRDSIQELVCVSDVLLQPKLVKIGDCVCSQQPELIVDDRTPSCSGTVCGDVGCNESKTCQTESGRSATVRCQWGGWKEISPGLFQPIISN